jgi:hypothetical protein
VIWRLNYRWVCGDDWLIITGFSRTLIPSFIESWQFQSEDQNMKQNFMCLWFPSFLTNQGGTVFLCLLNALVHRTHPLSSSKNLGEIIVPIYRTQGDSVKHSRQKLVQTAKYCLPQITYLLIHVFLINFRQGNVKLVLLKEFKPIILHFASEN